MTASESHSTDFPEAQPDASVLTVYLLGVPVRLQHKGQQHNDELTREMTLIAEQLRRQQRPGRAFPTRLVELVNSLARQYAGVSDEQNRQLEEARASGVETLDLTYQLPASAVDAVRALGHMLDEADEYCREGKHLLTLAAPPELVTYRHWFLSQFTDQAAGRPPVRWSDYRQGMTAFQDTSRRPK